MIRALALVPKPVGISPGQRFRLEQWAPLLERSHEILVDFKAFESPELTQILYEPKMRIRKAMLLLRDAARRAQAVATTEHYDVAIVYREVSMLGPAVYERWLCHNLPVVFDFDDAIWLSRSGSSNGVFALLRFPGKTATICRLAAGVMVGNAYLEQFARRHNRNVSVVPTTVNLAEYSVQPEVASESPFVITWSGSHSTLAHLDAARTAITELSKRRPVKLRVICDRPQASPFAGVETEFVRWAAEGEAGTLGATHVGIMPLPDNEFTRGKCGLKALTYMATGRPVIASPVGINAALIADGENGLLASNAAEWVACLEHLADSPAERRRLGAAGRKTVEQGFSAEEGASRAAKAIRAAVESHRSFRA